MSRLNSSRAIPAAVAASLVLTFFSVRSEAQIRFELSAQPMAATLAEIGNVAGMNVLFDSALVDGLKAPALNADIGADEALTRVLSGTHLRAVHVNASTISILTEADAKRAERSRDARVSSVYSTKSIRLAYSGTDPGSTIGSSSDQPSSESNSTPDEDSRERKAMAEVLVSAEKREERLQDVPIPVTAISGAALTASSQVRLQDYYDKVPGLNLEFGGTGNAPVLSIRGLSNGAGGPPTVGVVIDDVPYGSATGLSARGQPDIDPGDLARVEVLRGPQGTLYGASSMGGLLKFVTIDPSTEGWSGRIQAGTSAVFHGDNPGYNFRGSVNIPVNETIAVRASAFRELDPGYIDNIQTGQDGINRRTSEGGRLAGIWKPSDVFSLKLSALVQHSKRDGTDQATIGPGFGDLQIRTAPNTYTLDEKTQAYSATLNAKFGIVDFVSLTGYSVDSFYVNDDDTRVSDYFWAGLAQTYVGINGAVLLDNIGSRRFSQEFRMSMPLGSRITWMLGAFYTDEKGTDLASYVGADPVTGATGNSFFTGESTLEYKEYAAFTNLQVNITDQLDVQLGGRASRNTQTSDILRSGGAAALFYGDTLAITGLRAKDTPITYLVTPRYKITPDLMLYTRLASGYRPGGPNTTCTTGVPCDFDAEKTKNYELGLKADFLDHVFTVDTSLYYIDWTNIQVGLNVGQIGYTANAGKAKSQGLEFTVEARPFGGLVLSSWVAWNDAQYKNGFSSTSIAPGDRLPYGAKFSGNLSADEDFVVSGALTGFVGATVRYAGERLGGVQDRATTPRADFPGYAQTDVHAGIKYQTWTATAFANNVADRRGKLAGGIDNQYNYADPNTYAYIQPRTVGLNVAKTF